MEFKKKTVFILSVNLLIILLFFGIKNITLCDEPSFFFDRSIYTRKFIELNSLISLLDWVLIWCGSGPKPISNVQQTQWP